MSLNSSIDMQKRNNTADVEQLKFGTANILIFVTVNILKKSVISQGLLLCVILLLL